MTPKKTTVEGERQEELKAVCDEIIARAAVMMVEKMGASIPMMLDRMLTYAAAQACTIDGSPKTATEFRRLADKIQAGLFHTVTGEDQVQGKHH